MTTYANHRKFGAIQKLFPTFARSERSRASLHLAGPGMPKLNEDTVRKIRTEAKHWPLRALAARYGVRIATISEIINQKTWARVA